MTLTDLWNVIQTIGGIASIVVTLASFWALVIKKPKEALKNLIREEAKAANNELEDNVKELNKQLKGQADIDRALIKNAITQIYFKYLDKKQIPSYEKQNLLSLFENYQKLNGNSYVAGIVEVMKQWEEIS